MGEADVCLLTESYTGNLGPGDDNDWYRLEITKPIRLIVIDSTTNTLDYKINIYDADANLLVSGRKYSDNSGINAAKSLLPGIYYIRFWRDWGTGFNGEGQYYFHFIYEEVPMDNEPNNTMEESNTIEHSTFYSGNLGHTDLSGIDDFDYYILTLPQDGRIIVYDTTTNSLEYEVHIYDAQGDNLNKSGFRYSDNSGKNAAASLAAGTYYILFWRHWSLGFNGEGGYSFRVDFLPVNEDPEPNNTFQKASAVEANQLYYGNLGHSDSTGIDDYDYFKLTLDQDGRIFVNDSSTNGLEYEVHIYDHQQDNLNGSGNRYHDNSGKNAAASLAAGDYYILFWRHWSLGFTGEGEYSFTIEYLPVNEDPEPNDTHQTASIVETDQLYYGNLGHSDSSGIDDFDYYKLILEQDGRIVINDSATNGLEYEVHFYDHQLDKLNGSGNRYSDNSGKNAAASLAAGTYYIQFWRHWSLGFTGEGEYSFTIDYTPLREDPEPNDLIADASSVEIMKTIYGNLGHVDSSKTDDYDYHRFSLTEPGKVSILDTATNGLEYQVFFKDLQGDDLSGAGFRYSDESGKEAVNYFEPGEYCVLFWRRWSLGFTGDGEYNFFIKHEPVPADLENNDSFEEALPMTIDTSYGGNLGHRDSLRIDNYDYYVIDLKEDGRLMIHDSTFSGLSYQVLLYDENRNSIQSIYRYSDNSGARIERNLPAGKYYYLLWRRTTLGFGGAGKYKVDVNFQPLPIPGFNFHSNLNEVKFMNHTKYGETYHWDFGDGTESAEGNPSHLFHEPGEFIITLTSTNDAGSKSISDTLSIYGIKGISPLSGGNNGQVTLSVLGGGFSENSFVKLYNTVSDTLKPLSVVFSRDGLLEATFDMEGISPGIFNLQVTTPGKPTISKESAFTLEEGGFSQPWVHLSGRSVALRNRWSTYTIEFGNSGNLDAEIVPVFITVSDPENNEVDFPDMKLLYGDYAVDNNQMSKLDSLQHFFDLDSIWDQQMKTRVFAYYIPRIPAGFSGSITMKVKTSDRVSINVWNTEPLMEKGTLKSVFADPESQLAKCLYDAKKRAALDLGASYLNLLLPGSNCIYSIGKEFYTIRQMRMESFTKRRSWGDFSYAMTSLFLACVGDVVGIGKIYDLAIAITSTVTFLHDAVYAADKKCREKFGKQSLERHNIRGVNSFDPNEITGPKGYGDKNYISKTNSASYTIFFENKDTASAPAQEIWISDTLDKSVFDLTRFSFNSISLGDSIYHFRNGQSEFAMDIDYRPQKQLVGRALGSIDTITGIISVYFGSLNPDNLYPNEDPGLGILPPNINSPEGEGSISFTVGLKNPEDGDSFSNQAKIVFDFNDPILTNLWSNTIDDNKPVSEVSSINYSESNGLLEITAIGDDAGSGLELVTVFVSVNDSAYYPLGNITENVIYFTPLAGSNNYKFYSVASDSLGHIENEPESFDIQTDIIIGISDDIHKQVKIYPQPASDKVFIESKGKAMYYQIISGTGSEMNSGKLNPGINELDVSDLPRGIQIIKITGDKGSIVRKLVLN